jgi:hypothetical protein
VDVDEYSYTERGYLDAPRGPFSHLAASEQRTCGATATSLECWSDESGSMAYSSIADLDGAPRGGGLVLLGDGAVHDWQGSLVSGQAAALGAGSSLSCALDPSGYAHCWPAAVIPEDEFRELTGGGDYMCGLRTNGTVLCWNRQGPDAGVEPPKGEFETISSGHSHVCGLRPDKTIECWGGSKFGDIRPPTGTFVDVEAGAHTTCDIREQGGVTCWGDDSLFQASPPADISSENRGFTRISTGGSAVNVGGTQTDDTVDPPYEWLVPSPGHATACALRVDGSFDCFGHAETLVPRDRKFRALAADGRAICGVTSDGLECWGDSTSPLDGTAHEGDFVDVSIAWGVVCVLDGAGKIACFGPRSLALPANVEDGTFLQVSAGGTDGSSRDLAVCALHDDQSVTCWGYDINLELGTRHSPAGSFDHISTGYYYACGTLTDGTASCWDREGGTVEAIEGTFTRVLAGIQQNCGLRSNGSVSCWTTRYGNLDLVEIVALRGDYAGRFVDLSMGGDYVCGILEEGGGIKCWGARGR